MTDQGVFIHSTATVHKDAVFDSGVYIGPYSYISNKVSIHKNTHIDVNVTIEGPTEIGADCHFTSHSVIGGEPQDVTSHGEETRLVIGCRNKFREFITVNRGSINGGGITTIGDDNYFMAYTHIGHDCIVGNQTIFANGATLGGHVEIHDHTYISAFSGIHQFCRVGKYAFLGGFTVITQDVLPFCRVAGMRPPLLYGLNAIGLRRTGFSRDRIKAIKKMFTLFFFSDLNTSQAVERIKIDCPQGEDREEFLGFVDSSKRGFVKKALEKWEKPME